MLHWTLFFLAVLVIIVQSLAGHLPLVTACVHHDVWVKCIPVCPKICSEYRRLQKCIPRKCQAGCACKPGWVRKNSGAGYCIPKSACRRYIIH